jgi:hypothetical protein
MLTSHEQTAKLFCASCRASGSAKWSVNVGAHFSEISLEELTPGFRFITCHGRLLAKIECMRCFSQVLAIEGERLKRTG